MRLRTLGGLELEGTSLNRPQPLLLLTYLALEGPKDRRHLAELFWSGAANPLNSLSSALSRLRKSATGVVEADNVRVRANVQTDASEVLEALEKGHLSAALKLYQGRFLDGFYLQDWSAELEEWVYGTREFLAARVREGLLRCAENEAARGHFEAAAQHADQAYLLAGAPQLEPDDFERLYSLMITGQSFRTAEVRKEAEDFGIDLSLSVKQARETYGQRKDGVVANAGQNLPTLSTTFIGRELERLELNEQLEQEDCQVLTLLGLAGSGKTRLALQLAREQTARTWEGVYFVALDALSTTAAVPSSLAGALGIRLQGSLDPFEQVTRFIGEKRLLLILDNYEHLLEAATMVSDLVERCPKLTLLVTSRERLNLAEEWVYRLSGLAYPSEASISLEDAQYQDAVHLFVQRAKSSDLRFSLTSENLADVLSICRLVDGSPLGIELSAVWVKLMQPADIARELSRNLDFLSTPTRNVPERHRSLRAAFEQSWKLLTLAEQEVLRKLSVFRGGFRREAASQVVGASIPVLASLHDKALLRVSATGRFDRHPLMYQFAQEKLAERPEELAQMQEKHGLYFFDFIQEHYEEVRTERQLEIKKAFAEELENIKVAWRWGVVNERVDELKGAVFPLDAYFRDRLQESLEFLHIAISGLSEDKSEHHAALGYVFISKAYYQSLIGHYDEARTLAQRGLVLLEPLEEVQGVLEGLLVRAYLQAREGKFGESKKFYEACLRLARKHDLSFYVARAIRGLAIVSKDVDPLAQSKQFYREWVAELRDIGDLISLSTSLMCHSALFIMIGEPDQAQPLVEECLEIQRKMGYLGSTPYSLNNLGFIALLRGKYGHARDVFKEAVTVADTVGDLLIKAFALADLAIAVTYLGDLKAARDYVEQSLEIGWSTQSPLNTTASLVAAAMLKAAQGDPVQAAIWITVVKDHPALVGDFKYLVKTFVEELQDRLPTEVYAEAVRRGEALEFEEVLEGILHHGQLDQAVRSDYA